MLKQNKRDMNVPYTWYKIDTSTHLTNDMTSFHVDTDNFMYMFTTDELNHHNVEKYYEEDVIYCKKLNKLLDRINSEEEIDDKYLMTIDRVIPFIFSMREITKLNKTIGSDYVRWLRFYPYKGKYIVTNECEPLDWEKLIKIQINSENH